MKQGITPYSGKSGLAGRINQIDRELRRLQPQSAPGVLTSVSPLGVTRKPIVKGQTVTTGTSGWL